jgi:hypothetical protein
MLVVDRQRANGRKHQPGANPAFLEASDEVVFDGRDRDEMYMAGWNRTSSVDHTGGAIS